MGEFIGSLIVILGLFFSGYAIGKHDGKGELRQQAIDRNLATFESTRKGKSVFLWNDEVEQWKAANKVVK
jgi:hypothetical protein